MKKISILLIVLLVLSVGLLSGYNNFKLSVDSDDWIGFGIKKE